MPTTASPRSPSARPWWVPLIAVLVVALAWLRPMDRLAEEHLKAGVQRALTTYAVARTLNGVISVAQETGVSVQPAGVGMTFAPGQLLDPLNDLVEQFSGVMLAASVSFGIQLILLHLGGSAAVSALLTVGVAAFALLAWTGRPVPRWASRFLLALVLVRFAVPLAATASELSYDFAMAAQYRSAQAALSTAGVPAASGPSDAGAESRSWWPFGKDEGKAADPQPEKARIDQLKERLEGAVQHLLELVAIFVLQTVVLPLLFVLLLGKLVGALLVR